MQPFERLRYLARWGEDGGAELLGEAADCLAAFDGDPAGLVVACRRLLAHHPATAPLWWLCSRVLAAPDATEAAWASWQAFQADHTAEHLATALPFPHDEPVAVLGWPEVIATGLTERSDLDVVVVAPRRRAEQVSRRLRRAEQPVRVVGEAELLAFEPTHLLVDALAGGGGRALTTAGAGDLAGAARAHGTVVWLVVGLGRALPERLFEALLRASGDVEGMEVIRSEAAERVVGPNGVDTVAGLARRADCPTAPELLRLPG